MLHLRTSSTENIDNHFTSAATTPATKNIAAMPNGDEEALAWRKPHHDTPFSSHIPKNKSLSVDKSNRALYEKSIADYLKHSSVSTYENNQQQFAQLSYRPSRYDGLKNRIF